MGVIMKFHTLWGTTSGEGGQQREMKDSLAMRK